MKTITIDRVKGYDLPKAWAKEAEVLPEEEVQITDRKLLFFWPSVQYGKKATRVWAFRASSSKSYSRPVAP